jgi:hypothetical protein
MCLAPVTRPEGPAPKGQENLAQGLYVFSVGHAPKVPAIGAFQFVARSGQKSIAQGLSWVNSPTAMSPEGAGRYNGNRLRTSELDRVHISGPFRAKTLIFGLPRVNPGLCFLGHFGPQMETSKLRTLRTV